MHSRVIFSAGCLCALGASVSGAVFTYTIDQSLSELRIVGGDITIQGAVTFDIQEAFPDSLRAPLSGMINADISGDAISILASSRVRAVDHTDFLPGPPGDQGTATPGSFAIFYPTAPALGFDFSSVTRDLVFGVEDGTPEPISPGGMFGVSEQVWSIVSGVSDLNAGNPPQSDLTTVAPVINDPGLDGTLELNGLIETITIPVSFTMNIFGNLTSIDLQFEGTVVATRIIPTPGAAMLLGGALACGVMRRRR